MFVLAAFNQFIVEQQELIRRVEMHGEPCNLAKSSSFKVARKPLKARPTVYTRMLKVPWIFQELRNSPFLVPK